MLALIHLRVRGLRLAQWGYPESACHSGFCMESHKPVKVLLLAPGCKDIGLIMLNLGFVLSVCSPSIRKPVKRI